MNRIEKIKKDENVPYKCKKCNKRIECKLKRTESHQYNPYLCEKCYLNCLHKCYCDECLIFMLT
jgi:hypothetical protein